MLLPFMVLPSLATIVYVFYVAYRQKVLSEIHPLILMLGYGVYFFTNILRPVLKNLIENESIFIIIVELIDIFVFIIIFIGFIKKIDYK